MKSDMIKLLTSLAYWLFQVERRRIEKTEWAIRFKAEHGDGTRYRIALKYAIASNAFHIKPYNGKFVVSPKTTYLFPIAFCDTMDEAIKLCHKMKWKIE